MLNKIVPTEPARFEPGLPRIGEAILSQQFTATPAVKQVNKINWSVCGKAKKRRASFGTLPRNGKNIIQIIKTTFKTNLHYGQH